MCNKPELRRGRKGGALAAAMIFMVTVAGAALLSMSSITRVRIVKAGEDVRLLIAAEAGLETRRGMFVLVAGVQDDWSILMPTSGWNNVGDELNINGIRVQVQAQPIGDATNLQARLRSIAYGYSRNRAVEYNIQAANFADYALYFGGTNSVGIGSYFKMVGNFYSRGSINLQQNPGIEFFSRVETSETVLAAPDPIYNFKEGYLNYVPIIEIPPTAYGTAPMRAAAAASNTLFYANTISIQLVGTQFVRTYEYRFQGTGTNYNPNHYQIRTQTLSIPDNSVIYIDSDKCPAGVDTYQAGATTANAASYGSINMWGVLDNRRVTVACEHEVHITNNVSYQTLLDNPDLRRFTQKKSGSALGFREMLGVLSLTDLLYETPLWTPLPPGSMVTDNAALNPPDIGHHALQYSLDGVFMGVDKSARGAVGPGTGRELWVCGGIINGNFSSTLLSSNFDRRNYDTDYRLKFTTPPYFLRAYGHTPTYISGTWRTYEV